MPIKGTYLDGFRCLHLNLGLLGLILNHNQLRKYTCNLAQHCQILSCVYVQRNLVQDTWGSIEANPLGCFAGKGASGRFRPLKELDAIT